MGGGGAVSARERPAGCQCGGTPCGSPCNWGHRREAAAPASPLGQGEGAGCGAGSPVVQIKSHGPQWQLLDGESHSGCVPGPPHSVRLCPFPGIHSQTSLWVGTQVSGSAARDRRGGLLLCRCKARESPRAPRSVRCIQQHEGPFRLEAGTRPGLEPPFGGPPAGTSRNSDVCRNGSLPAKSCWHHRVGRGFPRERARSSAISIAFQSCVPRVPLCRASRL